MVSDTVLNAQAVNTEGVITTVGNGKAVRPTVPEDTQPSAFVPFTV